MLGWVKSWSERRRTGQELYERIVAQARNTSLFACCGVPDTMDGRLEMLLLHTVLSLDRLKTEGAEGQRLGQRLMEELISDVDDALRRVGLGDDSVAVRVRRLAGALAERSRDYGHAFQASKQSQHPRASIDPSAALEIVLREHVYGAPATSQSVPQARLLADYVLRARAALAILESGDVLGGRITFPPVLRSCEQAEAQL